MFVTGEWFKINGTTSVPKSVPRLVLVKVRLVPVIQLDKDMSVITSITVPRSMHCPYDQ